MSLLPYDDSGPDMNEDLNVVWKPLPGSQVLALSASVNRRTATAGPLGAPAR